jgi:hypothetical protein
MILKMMISFQFLAQVSFGWLFYQRGFEFRTDFASKRCIYLAMPQPQFIINEYKQYTKI